MMDVKSGSSDRDVWVVIPCYNEGPSLQLVLDQITQNRMAHASQILEEIAGLQPTTHGYTPAHD